MRDWMDKVAPVFLLLLMGALLWTVGLGSWAVFRIVGGACPRCLSLPREEKVLAVPDARR